MSVIDLDRLLTEISPGAPSGEKDLGYDPVFMELQEKINKIEGKIPLAKKEKKPSWPEIQKAAFELSTRTHDLRVAMFLTRALLHAQGLIGFRDGLSLIQGLIEQYWDTLYPQLDPEDNNDPTQRINILVALCEGEDIIGPLSRTYLCVSREVGRFSLRDIHIANGKIDPTENDKKHSVEIINAAFKKCDPEDLQATQAAISSSLQHLDSLDGLLMAKVGSASAPDFKELNVVLEEMDDFFEKQLGARASYKPSAKKQKVDTEETKDASVIHRAGPVAIPTDKPMGMINNRQDVIRILDQICTYYQQNEPGSPVPLLLKRARQLVEKNFFEIMQDLAPESAAQIETLISGATDDTS